MTLRALGAMLWAPLSIAPVRIALGGAALSFLFTAAAAQEPKRDAALPTSQELEAQHAIIGEIRIVNGDVFDTNLPEEDKWLFRLANSLHILSRPEIIARQVLVNTGDPYSDRLLRESERILRANRYLYDAEIVPIRYHDGIVDIEVRTRDVWTLKPGIIFSRSGGANAGGFQLQESNLLGYGKEITVSEEKDVDRTSSELRYYDSRLLGSWNRLSVAYSENSDGRRQEYWADHPFYSLDSRWSANIAALDWTRTDARYNLGQVVDEFRHYQESYELGGGWSDGLRDGWVTRVNLGFKFARDQFAATTNYLSATNIPPDRTLAYPFIGFSVQQDKFEARHNQNQIERTEDLYTGSYLQGSIGYAAPAYGADRTAWLWAVAGGTSIERQERKHTVVLSSALSGRIESGVAQNVVANASATYYWRVTEQNLFYASLHATATDRLDEEQQVLLGGDNGLRGYPLRYQDGNSSALLTLEHRFFTKYYLFRLFHLGGAVFFDMGRTWGAGNGSLANTTWPPGIDPHQGLLKDVGFGLRFGSSRSSFGNVLHVDLAFPLDGDPSIKNVQLVVETKQSF
jgi:outer membrane protein assembly factor BamA